MKPYLKRLGNNTSLNISAHPNAGLPNAFGQYDQKPEEMQQLIREYLHENLVNIIGGCCGTTPEHIKLIAEVAKEFKPREIRFGLKAKKTMKNSTIKYNSKHFYSRNDVGFANTLITVNPFGQLLRNIIKE